MNAINEATFAFYLGTHEISWLTSPLLAHAHARLFISFHRFRRRKSRPPLPRVSLAIDSGGFSEVVQKGGWTITAQEYTDFLVDLEDHQITPDWAAPQDWMCEPEALAATGRTIEVHQHLTVTNFCQLWQLWPHDRYSFPIMPVLQGYTIGDYLRCRQLYADYGVPLHRFELIGVGSVCRRQNTAEATQIMRELAAGGLRLHGFGFKSQGLLAAAPYLRSADSLAWSSAARRDAAWGRTMPGCTHRTCSSCDRYAVAWLHRLRTRLGYDQPDFQPPTEAERRAWCDQLMGPGFWDELRQRPPGAPASPPSNRAA